MFINYLFFIFLENILVIRWLKILGNGNGNGNELMTNVDIVSIIMIIELSIYNKEDEKQLNHYKLMMCI